MTCEEAVYRLATHEAELRAMGLVRLSLFGSTARGEARPESDVDIAAVFDPNARIGMFKLFDIEERLREIVGVEIDLVGEPARRPRLQANIDRDRVNVF